MRQETRDKIMRAADEIGYRPNDLAHSLRRARSQTIGIISNDSFGRFTIPIVEALEERLADEGIAVFMCNATDDPARERQHLDQLLRKRIDGLVVTARRADTRPPIGPFAHGLPVVYVFTHADDPGALCLLPDDEGGAVLAVEHLAGARPPPHRPHHRAGALRGGAPPPIRLASGARRRRAVRSCRASTCPASGRRPGAARPSPGSSTRPRRRTRSSAATTRSPAAPPTRCASAASTCPATSPSSASTTGT